MTIPSGDVAELPARAVSNYAAVLPSSFLESVQAMFDRAVLHVPVQEGLAEKIRICIGI